jgi:hypothetical protein
MALTKPKCNEDPLFAFIAYNLLPETHQTLITQHIWRTDFVCFWVYLTDEVTPTYLGYISGLSSIEDNDNLNSARDKIIGLWLTNTNVTNAVCDFISKGRSIDAAGDLIVIDDDKVREILNHLQMACFNTLSKGRLPHPSLNLYISDLKWTHAQFKALKEAISNVVYNLYLHGCGNYGHSWPCGQCHSPDHPTSLCYFNDIENDIPLTVPIVPTLSKAQQPPRIKAVRSTHDTTLRG